MMKEKITTFENSTLQLRRAHIKVTKNRVHIMEVLQESLQPLSAEEIYLLIRDKDETMDFSTIYRTLEILVENKIARKLNIMEDGRKLYSFYGQEHSHYLVCKECKKIITIHSCPLEKYEKELEDETGFLIDSHCLYLYGTCDDCQNKKIE